MAMRVVNDLEVVEIHVQECEGPRIAAIAVQLLAEPVGERAGIQDVGELILDDEAGELCLAAPQTLQPGHSDSQHDHIGRAVGDAP